MKKILFALTVFMMVGVAANAQVCTKGKKACCAAKKTASVDKDANVDTRVASAMTEADIAAEADANVSARTCEISGAKAYYMKSVCETSGSVSWSKAEFCDKSKKFTQVASASMEKDVNTGEVKAAPVKKQCSKKCTKGAKSCTAKKVGA